MYTDMAYLDYIGNAVYIETAMYFIIIATVIIFYLIYAFKNKKANIRILALVCCLAVTLLCVIISLMAVSVNHAHLIAYPSSAQTQPQMPFHR